MPPDPDLRPADYESLGLPPCYAARQLWVIDRPIVRDLEVVRWMALIERQLGTRPTVLVRNLDGWADARLLMNPYPRPVMLAALGVDEPRWLETLATRLAAPSPGRSDAAGVWDVIDGFAEIPVLRHRPRDAGRYVTSGVGVTRSPTSGALNLGVYRVQVTGPRQGLIFMDPRTDAAANWRGYVAQGQAMPMSIFIGADPSFMLTAASRLPNVGDDFAVTASLLGRPVPVDPSVLAPVDSQYVIVGRVLPDTEMEGPFAEFKGYYVEARPAPVFEVTEVLRATGAFHPVIVTGKESGLTLMAVQNEYLMYSHLRAAGYQVDDVAYTLDARAEYVTKITTPAPSLDLVKAAMAFDVRTKFVCCGPFIPDVWQAIATNGFVVHTEPYVRKGQVEGERIGIVFTLPPTGDVVEY